MPINSEDAVRILTGTLHDFENFDRVRIGNEEMEAIRCLILWVDAQRKAIDLHRSDVEILRRFNRHASERVANLERENEELRKRIPA